MTEKHTTLKLVRDIVFIIISITCAVFFVRLGILKLFLDTTDSIDFIGSFVSGIFFTSVFTTPLSIVSFAGIAQSVNIFSMAFFGACGSVVGDLLIFFFLKESLLEDVGHVVRAPKYKKIAHIFKKRIFRWLTPLLGALIIASPLPDELGLAMMGFSKVRTAILIPVSFTMNFLGILLIGIAAQAF